MRILLIGPDRMKKKNRLEKVISRTRFLPKKLRIWVRSKIFGHVVKLVNTAGIRFEHIDHQDIKLHIPNRTKMQNHIGGVHAAATALLGETASGFIVGMHVSDKCLPLLKTMRLNYVKRASGDMRATANLTPEQIELIRSTEKGELTVKVTITDDAGINPVEAEYDWAWIPKPSKAP